MKAQCVFLLRLAGEVQFRVLRMVTNTEILLPEARSFTTAVELPLDPRTIADKFFPLSVLVGFRLIPHRISFGVKKNSVFWLWRSSWLYLLLNQQLGILLDLSCSSSVIQSQENYANPLIEFYGEGGGGGGH